MLSFNEKCYAVLRKVPKGKVTTYKEIARALNSKAYRAVGSAMNKNPYNPEVPCHRVVKSNGEVGGFARGQKKKIEMLRREGIEIVAPQAYTQGAREPLRVPEPSRSERKSSTTLKSVLREKKDFSTKGKIYTKGKEKINLKKYLYKF